jgi:alpha-tubulin suppressor-like RCC1 family protein
MRENQENEPPAE